MVLCLVSLSPWKYIADQSKVKWRVYFFNLSQQSNNIQVRWCSNVSPGPRSLCAKSMAKGVFSPGGRGSASTQHVRWGQIPKSTEPTWLQHNPFTVEIERVCVLSDIASVLLLISEPGEKAVCFFMVHEYLRIWWGPCWCWQNRNRNLNSVLFFRKYFPLFFSLENIFQYSPLYQFSGGHVRG